MYHITITDLENGETVIDADTAAIIGAIGTDKRRADSFVLARGSLVDTVCVAQSAENTVKYFYANHPEAAAMATLLKALKDVKDEVLQ